MMRIRELYDQSGWMNNAYTTFLFGFKILKSKGGNRAFVKRLLGFQQLFRFLYDQIPVNSDFFEATITKIFQPLRSGYLVTCQLGMAKTRKLTCLLSSPYVGIK